MKHLLKIFGGVLGMLFLLLSSTPAQAKGEDEVYLFGLSASFKDSVVYITDIQTIKNANVLRKKYGFLNGRAVYSSQLTQYINGVATVPYVSSIFYSTSKSKAEKIYVRMRHKYQDRKGILLQMVAADAFRFTPVTEQDDAPVQVEQEDATEDMPSGEAPAGAPKKDKRSQGDHSRQ